MGIVHHRKIKIIEPEVDVDSLPFGGRTLQPHTQPLIRHIEVEHLDSYASFAARPRLLSVGISIAGLIHGMLGMQRKAMSECASSAGILVWAEDIHVPFPGLTGSLQGFDLLAGHVGGHTLEAQHEVLILPVRVRPGFNLSANMIEKRGEFERFMKIAREEFEAEDLLFHIGPRAVQKLVHHQRKHLLTKVCVGLFSLARQFRVQLVFRIPFLFGAEVIAGDEAEEGQERGSEQGSKGLGAFVDFLPEAFFLFRHAYLRLSTGLPFWSFTMSKSAWTGSA